MLGKHLGEAQVAMILAHGRGADARGMQILADELPHPAMVYLAPQAAGNTWYPYRFLESPERNEPHLSSALAVLAHLVEIVEQTGIASSKVFLAGFSQGACLVAEFAARNPRRYAGLLIFSGALIGPPGISRQPSGSLAGTPVLLGCSDNDPHIPLALVQSSAQFFRDSGAVVSEQILPGIGHTIVPAEIESANQIISRT
jgi:predicted esterase